MKLKFVGAAVALTLLSTTAMAADLPSRRAPPVYTPPPALPAFTWTGLYIGGHVGYNFGNTNGALFNNNNGILLATGGANPGNVIGGAHVGYLFSTQSLPVLGNAFGGGGVFGLEGDVDGSNYRANYALGGIGVTSRRDIQGSIRGRLGIAVDRVLFYATGGAAFGGLKNTYLNTLNGTVDSINRTRVGYTVGGGVEYAFTNNWSARVEYRYTDFGRYTDTLFNTTGGNGSVSHRENDHRVQAGVSYKFSTFNPVAPVVARY